MYDRKQLPDPATTSTQTEPFPPGLQFGPDLTTKSNLNKNIQTVQNKPNNNPSICVTNAKPVLAPPNVSFAQLQ